MVACVAQVQNVLEHEREGEMEKRGNELRTGDSTARSPVARLTKRMSTRKENPETRRYPL